MIKVLIITALILLILLSCTKGKKERLGCTNLKACNYDPLANLEDGSCTFAQIWYADPDNDGLGNPEDSIISCNKPESYVSNANDLGLPVGPSSDRHTKYPVGTKYAAQGYWEYLPVGYGNGNKRPLLIFLHGYGENGNGSSGDLDLLLAHGPPKLISNDRWPLGSAYEGINDFVVLSVQNTNGYCHLPDEINAFIRWAVNEYAIDITRIYLTGLSCGAYGIWDYLNAYLNDDLVAAVVPICGDGRPAWNKHGCNLGMIPIWAFHGGSDPVVNPDGTILPLNGLAACTDPPAVDARKTIYPGVEHDSWTQTYDLSAGHDIYAWLLSHSNPDAKL